MSIECYLEVLTVLLAFLLGAVICMIISLVNISNSCKETEFYRRETWKEISGCNFWMKSIYTVMKESKKVKDGFDDNPRNEAR